MDHVEKLSRGKKSGANIGSRAVSHHLQKFERDIYERALARGFLEIDERSRANLVNLWDKVCLAKQWKRVVVLKSADRVSGEVIVEGNTVFTGLLSEAKQEGKSLAQENK